MGLLRSLASKIVKRVTGAPAAASSPAPSASAAPRPAAEPVESSPGESLARIDCGPQELRERLDAGEQIVVVDVRTDGEVASGTLPNAKHIPLHELEARWQELKEANEIVCYCAAGMRSLKAAQLLREKGLFNATSMEGGINAWREIGGVTVLPD